MELNKVVSFFKILNVKVSAVNMDDTCQVIEQSIEIGRHIYISTCPVGTIVECQNNPAALISVNQADLVAPDGMPVVWLGKLMGFKRMSRVYGADIMLTICAISEKRGYRNFFYGSSQETLENLRRKLQEKFPNLVIAGTYAPEFGEQSAQDRDTSINSINSAGANIVWVGLGSPKQDIWMYENRGKISSPVMIGVGAAFDFISGGKKQAPLWMQRSGLEWLFMLISEPKRLWLRYLIGNTVFIFWIIKSAFARMKEEFMKDKIMLPALIFTLFALMIFMLFMMSNLQMQTRIVDNKVKYLAEQLSGGADISKALENNLTKEISTIKKEIADLNKGLNKKKEAVLPNDPIPMPKKL